MGLDVNLYAEVSPSDAEFDAAEAFLRARCAIAFDFDGHVLSRDEGRVVLNTLCRYYGPGYERGKWPDIYAAVRLLQVTFPGSKVFYGSDDTGFETTSAYMEDVWAHYLGPDGDSYHLRLG